METLSLEAGEWCCFQKAGRVGGGEESGNYEGRLDVSPHQNSLFKNVVFKFRNEAM